MRLSLWPKGGGISLTATREIFSKAYKFRAVRRRKGTELLDYDVIEKKARAVKPKMIVCAPPRTPRH